MKEDKYSDTQKTLQTQGLCKKVLIFVLQLLRTGVLVILFLPSYLKSLKGLSLISFTVFCVQKAQL